MQAEGCSKRASFSFGHDGATTLCATHRQARPRQRAKGVRGGYEGNLSPPPLANGGAGLEGKEDKSRVLAAMSSPKPVLWNGSKPRDSVRTQCIV